MPSTSTSSAGKLDLLWVFLASAAAYKLFRVAELNDADFHVYWKAAHDFFSHQFPYAVLQEDKGFVFKYPPWTLALFSPLAALSWDAARSVWFGVETLSLLYCVSWVIRQGVGRHLAILSAFLFWWIWQSHFAFGQFTLMLLAAALWACPPNSDETSSEYPVRTGIVGFVLSSKIFSLVTMAGLLQRLKNPKVWWTGLGLFALANALILVIDPSRGLVEYYQGWMQAAASGGTALGAGVIRGQQNHGFTTRILMALNVSAANTRADMLLSLGLSAIFGALWWQMSRPLRPAEKWCGWIALGVITHPLAWDHSFVMAYPLCALALDRSRQVARTQGNRIPLICAVIGTALIALMVPQLWGAEFVKPFELAANKCWGSVLAAVSLVLAARTETSKSEQHA